MTKPISAFDVLLGDTHVGTLSYSSHNDLTTFLLSAGYTEMANPPTLSLSFRNKSGGFTRNRIRTMVTLPAFFANLLPEPGPLRELIIKRASLKSAHDFAILSLLRNDLPGAVILKPAPGQPEDQDQFSQIAWPNSTINISPPLKFSLAGVQMKFSAALIDKTYSMSDSGENGDWIVKLPSSKFEQIPENEFATMKLAKAIGIEIPDIDLLDQREIKGLPEDISRPPGNCYAISRFDRANLCKRIHIEDFAQVFNLQPAAKYLDSSYQNIAAVIWQESGEESLVQFVRRLVFSILIGNLDMHLKNWSLIYKSPSIPSLSPAYDLISTVAYPGVDRKLALSLSKTKRPEKVTLSHIKQMAADAKLPESLVVSVAKTTIKSVREMWNDHRSLYPPNQLAVIEKYMQSLPLLSARTGPL